MADSPVGGIDPFGIKKTLHDASKQDQGTRFLTVYVGIGFIVAFLAIVSLAPQVGEKLGTLSVKKQTQESHAAGKPVQTLSGTCAVTPNPATLGGQYTVNGAGFRANELLFVQVADSRGSQYLPTSSDSSGSFSVGSYASWTGIYNVSVFDNTNPKKTVLVTTCSFQTN